jgi:RimJ/RimL family protein N-acetyltransferase
MSMIKLKFVEYSRLFLDKSWNWLNDKEIKELTLTPDFTKEDQIKFFNSLENNKQYYIRGIMLDDIPIGACGLKHITNKDGEYWGYIGNKNYWSKGLGIQILNYIIKYAIGIGLDSIYLNVSKDNQRAYKLYKKNLFEIESENLGVLRMRLNVKNWYRTK